jgi:CHAD domain-containing protein
MEQKLIQNHCFVFNATDQVQNWLEDLLRSDSWRQEELFDSRITYFDSFDWRLYRQDTALDLAAGNDRRVLTCRSLGGELLATHDDSKPPKFARDLPVGKLRQHLEPLLKMRRLLPQVTVHSRQQRLALLNNDDKTVLRLQLFFDCMAKGPQGPKREMAPHLQVLPLRRHHADAHRLAAKFETDQRLRPKPTNQLAEALASIGRLPADYSSKLDIQLQRSQNAQQALTTILLQLLATLRANLEGTCADLDSEFLHDFRVAIRRTRSALGQLKGILPAAEIAPFREGFSWLGTITGPTRDLDVYLLKFDAYRRLLPPHQQQDLEPFHHFLLQRQKREQQTLAAELRGPRFAGLPDRWQLLLERQLQADADLPAAKLPAREVAGQRIWKLYKRCLKEGEAIEAESPAEALHELRKTCKKLRYLLEFFQSLYPQDAINSLVKALKKLQDNLGDFQDYQVQGNAMLSFGLEMAEDHQAAPATLLAMGTLAGSLLHQQQQTREEFQQRFKTFCRPENRQLFKKLFAPANSKKADSQ